MSSFNDQIANNIVKGLAIKFLQGLTTMNDVTQGVKAAVDTVDGMAYVNKTMHTNVNDVSESIAKSTARIKKSMAENAERIRQITEGHKVSTPIIDHTTGTAPIVDFPKIEIPDLKIPEFKMPSFDPPKYPGVDHDSSEVIEALKSTINGLEFDLGEVSKQNEVLSESLSNEKDLVSAITEDIQKSYNKMSECFIVCFKYKDVIEALINDVNNQMQGMLLEVKQVIEKKEG
jgi:uncharacterized protein YoxC